MNRTAVIFSPKYCQHDPGRNHPESAQRLMRIMNELRQSRPLYNRNWQLVEPRKARVKDVKLVHDIGYIRHVRSVCRLGGGILDLGDTVVSPESFQVALRAVGGTLRAVELVMERKFQNAFALVRPPGHHASRFEACGFCVFNNIAIAAEYLLRKYRLKRIAVLDIDAHHGNGTQETFYATDKVLYMSLHEDPRAFPGTGFADELGEGKGLGFNVNVPLPFRTGDQVYLKAIGEIAEPILRQYKPQFTLVSAGFDGHYADPVGNLLLSVFCYREIWKRIVKLASETCEGKLVAVLEGGYSLRFVGRLVAAAILEMSGSRHTESGNILEPEKRVRIRGEKILEEVKKSQRIFWEI